MLQIIRKRRFCARNSSRGKRPILVFLPFPQSMDDFLQIILRFSSIQSSSSLLCLLLLSFSFFFFFFSWFFCFFPAATHLGSLISLCTFAAKHSQDSSLCVSARVWVCRLSCSSQLGIFQVAFVYLFVCFFFFFFPSCCVLKKFCGDNTSFGQCWHE